MGNVTKTSVEIVGTSALTSVGEENTQNFEALMDDETAFRRICMDPSEIAKLGEDLRDNLTLVLKAVSINGVLLEHVSSRLKKNKTVVKTALKNDPESLQYASVDLRGDKKIIIEALKHCKDGDGSAEKVFEYISNLSMKKDPDIFRETCRNSSSFLSNQISSELMEKSMFEDLEFMKVAVSKNEEIFGNAPPSIRDNRDFCTCAVKKTPNLLYKLSEDMFRDKEIVKIALAEDPMIYIHNPNIPAYSSCSSDDEMEEPIKKQTRLNEIYGEDREIQEFLISKDPKMYQHLSDTFKRDKTILKRALFYDTRNTLLQLPESYEADFEIVKYAIICNPKCATYHFFCGPSEHTEMLEEHGELIHLILDLVNDNDTIERFCSYLPRSVWSDEKIVFLLLTHSGFTMSQHLVNVDESMRNNKDFLLKVARRRYEKGILQYSETNDSDDESSESEDGEEYNDEVEIEIEEPDDIYAPTAFSESSDSEEEREEEREERDLEVDIEIENDFVEYTEEKVAETDSDSEEEIEVEIEIEDEELRELHMCEKDENLKRNNSKLYKLKRFYERQMVCAEYTDTRASNLNRYDDELNNTARINVGIANDLIRTQRGGMKDLFHNVGKKELMRMPYEYMRKRGRDKVLRHLQKRCVFCVWDLEFIEEHQNITFETLWKVDCELSFLKKTVHYLLEYLSFDGSDATSIVTDLMTSLRDVDYFLDRSEESEKNFSSCWTKFLDICKLVKKVLHEKEEKAVVEEYSININTEQPAIEEEIKIEESGSDSEEEQVVEIEEINEVDTTAPPRFDKMKKSELKELSDGEMEVEKLVLEISKAKVGSVEQKQYEELVEKARGLSKKYDALVLEKDIGMGRQGKETEEGQEVWQRLVELCKLADRAYECQLSFTFDSDSESREKKMGKFNDWCASFDEFCVEDIFKHIKQTEENTDEELEEGGELISETKEAKKMDLYHTCNFLLYLDEKWKYDLDLMFECGLLFPIPEKYLLEKIVKTGDTQMLQKLIEFSHRKQMSPPPKHRLEEFIKLEMKDSMKNEEEEEEDGEDDSDFDNIIWSWKDIQSKIPLKIRNCVSFGSAMVKANPTNLKFMRQFQKHPDVCIMAVFSCEGPADIEDIWPCIDESVKKDFNFCHYAMSRPGVMDVFPTHPIFDEFKKSKGWMIELASKLQTSQILKFYKSYIPMKLRSDREFVMSLIRSFLLIKRVKQPNHLELYGEAAYFPWDEDVDQTKYIAVMSKLHRWIAKVDAKLGLDISVVELFCKVSVRYVVKGLQDVLDKVKLSEKERAEFMLSILSTNARANVLAEDFTDMVNYTDHTPDEIVLQYLSGHNKYGCVTELLANYRQRIKDNKKPSFKKRSRKEKKRPKIMNIFKKTELLEKLSESIGSAILCPIPNNKLQKRIAVVKNALKLDILCGRKEVDDSKYEKSKLGDVEREIEVDMDEIELEDMMRIMPDDTEEIVTLVDELNELNEDRWEVEEELEMYEYEDDEQGIEVQRVRLNEIDIQIEDLRRRIRILRRGEDPDAQQQDQQQEKKNLPKKKKKINLKKIHLERENLTLHNLPKKFRKDRELVELLTILNPSRVTGADPKLKNDLNLAFVAFQEEPVNIPEKKQYVEIWNWFDNSLKSNEHLVSLAIQRNGEILKLCPDLHRNNVELVCQASLSSPDVLLQYSEKYVRDNFREIERLAILPILRNDDVEKIRDLLIVLKGIAVFSDEATLGRYLLPHILTRDAFDVFLELFGTLLLEPKFLEFAMSFTGGREIWRWMEDSVNVDRRPPKECLMDMLFRHVRRTYHLSVGRPMVKYIQDQLRDDAVVRKYMDVWNHNPKSFLKILRFIGDRKKKPEVELYLPDEGDEMNARRWMKVLFGMDDIHEILESNPTYLIVVRRLCDDLSADCWKMMGLTNEFLTGLVKKYPAVLAYAPFEFLDSQRELVREILNKHPMVVRSLYYVMFQENVENKKKEKKEKKLWVFDDDDICKKCVSVLGAFIAFFSERLRDNVDIVKMSPHCFPYATYRVRSIRYMAEKAVIECASNIMFCSPQIINDKAQWMDVLEDGKNLAILKTLCPSLSPKLRNDLEFIEFIVRKFGVLWIADANVQENEEFMQKMIIANPKIWHDLISSKQVRQNPALIAAARSIPLGLAHLDPVYLREEDILRLKSEGIVSWHHGIFKLPELRDCELISSKCTQKKEEKLSAEEVVFADLLRFVDAEHEIVRHLKTDFFKKKETPLDQTQCEQKAIIVAIAPRVHSKKNKKVQKNCQRMKIKMEKNKIPVISHVTIDMDDKADISNKVDRICEDMMKEVGTFTMKLRSYRIYVCCDWSDGRKVLQKMEVLAVAAARCPFGTGPPQIESFHVILDLFNCMGTSSRELVTSKIDFASVDISDTFSSSSSSEEEEEIEGEGEEVVVKKKKKKKKKSDSNSKSKSKPVIIEEFLSKLSHVFRDGVMSGMKEKFGCVRMKGAGINTKDKDGKKSENETVVVNLYDTKYEDLEAVCEDAGDVFAWSKARSEKMTVYEETSYLPEKIVGDEDEEDSDSDSDSDLEEDEIMVEREEEIEEEIVVDYHSDSGSSAYSERDIIAIDDEYVPPDTTSESEDEVYGDEDFGEITIDM